MKIFSSLRCTISALILNGTIYRYLPSTEIKSILYFTKLIFYGLGIYLIFTIWSVKQERLVTIPYEIAGEFRKFPSIFFISAAQTVAGCIISLLWIGSTDGVSQLYDLLHYRKGHKISSSATESSNTTEFDKYSQRELTSKSCSRSTMKMMLLMGLSAAIAPSFSYVALRTLSFPVVLIVKMSKMVPILIVGTTVYKVRYPIGKYLAALCITCGILLFLYFDPTRKPNKNSVIIVKSNGCLNSEQDLSETPNELIRESDQSGKLALNLGLVCINLFFDGFTCSTQDAITKRTRWKSSTLMFVTNFFTLLWYVILLSLLEVLPWLSDKFFDFWCQYHSLNQLNNQLEISTSNVCSNSIFNMLFGYKLGCTCSSSSLIFSFFLKISGVLNQLSWNDTTEAIHFFMLQPQAMKDLISISILNALGQIFVFQSLTVFGGVSTTALTLLRKVSSVLLSIFWSHHRILPQQCASLLLVFFGLIWDAKANLRHDKKCT